MRASDLDDRSVRTSQPPLPAHEREEYGRGEERPEDLLVVSSEPERQVDVEVVAALVRVPGRDVGQGAAHAIGGEHESFDRDDRDEESRGLELAALGDDRDGEDAGREHRPRRHVHQPDHPECRCGVIGKKSGRRTSRAGVSPICFRPRA